METGLTFDNLPLAVNQLSKKLDQIELLLVQNKDAKINSEVEKLLSIEEASNFLKLSVPTIYSKVSKGELPVMKKSKRLYFSNLDLIAYLKEGKKKSNSEINNLALDYINKKGDRR
jgi:excisionase family DNA binding protein